MNPTNSKAAMAPGLVSAAFDPASGDAILRRERDQALGCFILAFTISFAVIISAVCDPGTALANARHEVELHEELFRAIEPVVQENQAAVRKVREALAAIRRTTP